jgi:hypothetical protein
MAVNKMLGCRLTDDGHKMFNAVVAYERQLTGVYALSRTMVLEKLIRERFYELSKQLTT